MRAPSSRRNHSFDMVKLIIRHTGPEMCAGNLHLSFAKQHCKALVWIVRLWIIWMGFAVEFSARFHGLMQKDSSPNPIIHPLREDRSLCALGPSMKHWAELCAPTHGTIRPG